MPHILFAEKENSILPGLERLLVEERKNWTCTFSNRASDALQQIAEQEFDVVVADLRTPGMGGAELLRQVKDAQPATVRIAVGGFADEGLALHSVVSAHQILTRPIDLDQLITSIERAMALRELVSDPNLRELVARLPNLPAVPRIYGELLIALSFEDSSINRLCDLIRQDVALSAKILQIIHSALFALPAENMTIRQAVPILGLDMIRALTLSIQAFDQFKLPADTGYSLEALQRHSIEVMKIAKDIALCERLPTAAMENIALAAMLHDIGELIVVCSPGGEWKRILDLEATGLTRCEAERVVLQTTHAHLGAYLLGIWGLPPEVVGAIARQLDPEGSSVSPELIIHVADACAKRSCVDDDEMLDSLGGRIKVDERMRKRILDWRARQNPEAA